MAKNQKHPEDGDKWAVGSKTSKITNKGSYTKTSRIATKTVKGNSRARQIHRIHTMTAGDKINMIKNGVSKNDLQGIKDESNFDYDTLSNLLSVSRAKLINKKGTEKFDRATSERILMLADLIAYGQEVFEDRNVFNQWMKKTNKALGNKSPIELMDTMYGIQEVKKEIGRIEYGVF